MPISDARPILTAAAMRAAEERAMAAGASVGALMERAGTAVAEAAWALAGPVQTLILCGPGNNGGDGYVAARVLAERGMPVRVAASDEPTSQAARAAREAWGGPVEQLGDAAPATLVIDALFGTGLSRALDQAVAHPLAALTRQARLKVAVDLPSGVSTDDGQLLGPVPRFDMTVALGALKPAHLMTPAAVHLGRLVVADIGLGPLASDLDEVPRPRLAVPDPDSNKYSRGKVSLVAGPMAGATLLAATAAQAAGAGYVELIGSEDTGPPHALVRRPWTPDALADKRIGAVVIGPGLGHDDAARERLEVALASGHRLVIDADALSLIGKDNVRRLAGDHVLTPHWGEFTRLFGDDGRDRLAQARAAAERAGAVVILKGGGSIVAHRDGRAALAPLAPAWLASAGTGDVLSGIVGAMLAGGREPFAAALAAQWLHIEAGRRAGPFLIADDLVRHLPAACAACL